MSLFGQQPTSSGSSFGTQNPQNTLSKPSLFGSATASTQPTQSGSLFSSSLQPQSGSLFRGTDQNPQSQQSGSLFGTANQNTQSQQSGSFFGSTLNANQSSGTLFGAPTTTAPSQSGGLFGSANQASQMQQSGGLFGSTMNNPQQQAGGSIFGGSTTATNAQPGTGPSLFNRLPQPTNTTQSTPSGTTLNQSMSQQPFAQSLQSQPNRPSLSLFASNSTSQINPLNRSSAKLPSLTLGQSTTQPPTTPATGAKIDIAHLRGTTRFQDLTDALQNEIVDMERLVQAETSACEQISAALPRVAQDVAALPAEVDYIEGKIEAVENAIDGDGGTTRELKDIVQADADDCTRVFRCVENLKQPESLHYHSWPSGGRGGFQVHGGGGGGGGGEGGGDGGGGGGGSNGQGSDGAENMDLMGFFDRQADELKGTLAMYEKTLDEIEAHLRNVEMGVAQMGGQVAFKRGRGKEEQVRELAAVLREFEGGILGMAGKVGECRESAQEVIMRR